MTDDDAARRAEEKQLKHRQLTYGTCGVCGQPRDLRQTTGEDGKPKVALVYDCEHTEADQPA